MHMATLITLTYILLLMVVKIHFFKQASTYNPQPLVSSVPSVVKTQKDGVCLAI